MNRVIGAVAATFIAMGSLALTPGTASAWCVPNRGSYPQDLWTGWLRSGIYPGQQVSIQAGVREYWPYVSNTSVVSAWTMLDDTTGNHNYAQIGWWAPDKNNEHFAVCQSKCMFIEISSNGVSTHIDRHDLLQPTDATTYYLTSYLPASQTMVFYYNGNLLWQSYAISWAPNRFNALAETHNYADQMPGAVQSHHYFYNSQYYDGSQWRDLNWDGQVTPYNSNSYYFGAAEVPDVHHNVEVWDGGCPGT
jgi:hypothetical protein